MTPSELKAFRHAYALTQQKLADLLGVPRNTVNRWEMGLNPITHITELALREVERRLKRRKPQ